jgi:CheY-like chemotaxis protein
LQGLQVALVEDDAQVLEATVQLLQSWGIEVMAASDAHALLQYDAPQVIVCDWMLERSDGLAQIKQLREHWGPMPALLVSGAMTPALEEQAGAQNVRTLIKPVKPAALRAMLTMLRKAALGRR